MGKMFKHYFDPIQVLADDTVNNPNFNVREYCLWDVDRLRNIANLIEERLLNSNTNCD